MIPRLPAPEVWRLWFWARGLQGGWLASVEDLVGEAPSPWRALGLLERSCLATWREGGALVGLAGARPAGGHAWRVHRLHLAPGAEGCAGPLLSSLAGRVARRGAHRLWLRLPRNSPLVTLLGPWGFCTAFTERVYHLEAPPCQGNASPPPGLRPQRGADRHALLRLQLSLLPAPARALWAPTPAGWAGEWRGGLVAERDGRLTAWLRLQAPPWRRWASLYLALSPGEEPLPLLLWALSRLRGRRPIFLVAPGYCPSLEKALQGLGFHPAGEWVVLVKPVAVTMELEEPALAVAQG